MGGAPGGIGWAGEIAKNGGGVFVWVYFINNGFWDFIKNKTGHAGDQGARGFGEQQKAEANDVGAGHGSKRIPRDWAGEPGAGEEDFYVMALGLRPGDDGVVEGEVPGCAGAWQFVGDER